MSQQVDVTAGRCHSKCGSSTSGGKRQPRPRPNARWLTPTPSDRNRNGRNKTANRPSPAQRRQQNQNAIDVHVCARAPHASVHACERVCWRAWACACVDVCTCVRGYVIGALGGSMADGKGEKNVYLPWPNRWPIRAMLCHACGTRVHASVCASPHACLCPCPCTCVCTCMYACMRLHMHTCAHVCMCGRACVHACMRACMRACVRACVRVCMCACMCVCACAKNNGVRSKRLSADDRVDRQRHRRRPVVADRLIMF